MDIKQEIANAVICPDGAEGIRKSGLYSLTYAQRTIWALRLTQNIARITGETPNVNGLAQHAGVKGYDIQYAAYIENMIGSRAIQLMLINGELPHNNKKYTSIRTLYWVLQKEQSKKEKHKSTGNIENDLINNRSIVNVILEKISNLFGRRS